MYNKKKEKQEYRQIHFVSYHPYYQTNKFSHYAVFHLYNSHIYRILWLHGYTFIIHNKIDFFFLFLLELEFVFFLQRIFTYHRNEKGVITLLKLCVPIDLLQALPCIEIMCKFICYNNCFLTKLNEKKKQLIRKPKYEANFDEIERVIDFST